MYMRLFSRDEMKFRKLYSTVFCAILFGGILKLCSFRLFNRVPAPKIRIMPLKHNINLLTATAGDVRRLLEVGEASSVELVKLYLKQISAHNHEGLKLNAMISVAAESSLLEEASKLDAERSKSGPRSRLHGIPIILKV